MEETLRKEVRMLTTRLGAIAREQCGPRVFSSIESLRRLAKQIRERPCAELLGENQRVVAGLAVEDAASVAHAFSLFFHLVNLCEERERIRRLKAYERQETGAPMSLRRTFRELRRKGVPRAKIDQFVRSMRVGPVFTAHPTEAKRRSVFNHVLRLARTLEQAAGDASEAAAQIEARVDPWIEALWLTDEVRDRPVTPEIEIENTLVYFERGIYDLAGTFWLRFLAELRAAFPGLAEPEPFFEFGSWVGTDRDGNPNVTRAASLEAAEAHRRSILRYYAAECRRLLALISFPCRNPRLAARMNRDLERVMRRFPQLHALESMDQPEELYRRKLRVMLWRVRRTLGRAPGAYEHPRELAADARLLEELLREQPSPRVATLGPARLRIAAAVFGFHGVSHDFRQHAAHTRAAAGELLRAAGLPDAPPEARSQSIQSLLCRPDPPPDPTTLAAQKTIDELKTLKEIQDLYGAEAARRYILSMSMASADLWDVLLLARKAGLIEWSAGPPGARKSQRKPRLRSRVDVIPLFETYDDLIRCPEILEEMLSSPVYQEILRSRGEYQEIMLGYSDSVKDSGYMAANWSLFRAQDRLERVARKHGVKLCFFHGKGGTIDRGGGMSYRSVQAQPHAAPGGRLRITEQGEVISFKYSNPVIARRNLEQLTSSVIDANLLHPRPARGKLRAAWESYAHELAESSRKFYRNLVYETPEFPTYFFQATPIDLIDLLRLGSRPSRRYRSREIEDLRAIPWVFSWTQSRHFLPSWYGLGFALDEFVRRHEPDGLEWLRKMYREWPFFSVLVDNAEVSLAKTDLYIAGCYAKLVRQAEVREKIFGRIEEEHARTVARILQVRDGKRLLERQPVLAESIRLRNPYVDPLNFLQLHYLDRWRKDGKASPALLRLLQMTVGGVAFGMKSTG